MIPSFHSSAFPQVFIPHVAGSTISQTPKLHIALYFLAYLNACFDCTFVHKEHKVVTFAHANSSEDAKM